MDPIRVRHTLQDENSAKLRRELPLVKQSVTAASMVHATLQPVSIGTRAIYPAAVLAFVMLLASPRSIILLGFGLILLAAVWTFRSAAIPFRFWGSRCAVALGLWAVASALWSPVPLSSLEKGALLTALIAGTIVVANRITEWTARGMSRPNVAPWYGVTLLIAWLVIVGAVLLSIEALTGQALAKAVLQVFPSLVPPNSRHVILQDGVVTSISEAEINRRTAVVSSLLLPALYVLLTRLSSPLRFIGLGLGSASFLILMLKSSHQSSQLALCTGLVMLILALLSWRVARGLLLAGWVASALLMVPITLAAYHAQLHKADWLFNSAKHRVVIWAYVAEKIGRAPLLGVGADGGRLQHATVEKDAVVEFQKKAGVGVVMIAHPHNLALQVWYELGAVGGLLWAALGVAVLLAIGRISDQRERILALAQFGLIAALTAFSYGIWQPWLQAFVSVSIVATILAMHPTASDLRNRDTSNATC